MDTENIYLETYGLMVNAVVDVPNYLISRGVFKTVRGSYFKALSLKAP